MDRRRFEHLFVELSMLLGRLVPRFRLWLYLRENGADPESLTRHDVLGFCDSGLVPFLSAEGLSLSRRQQRKLRRGVAAFDPALSSPAELLSDPDGEGF